MTVCRAEHTEMKALIKICYQLRDLGITNVISTNAAYRVSSIVYEFIKTILSLFIYLFIYLFYEKILKKIKSTKTQTNDFHPLRSFYARKTIVAFIV